MSEIHLITAVLLSVLPSWAQASEQNLRPNQVLVKTEISKGTEYPLKIKGMLFIEAKPKVVWGVLTDYEHLEGVFPRLKSTRILRRDAEEIVVEQLYHGLLFLSKAMEFASRETPMQRIDFRRLGGKSKVAGYWSLEPAVEDSTILTLELMVRPRRFIPLLFMKSMLTGHIPHGLIAIRQRSLTKIDKNPSEEPEIIHLEE